LDINLSMAPEPGGATRPTLALFDIQGRLVRNLAGVAATGATQHLHWDGRDEGGHSVGRGVFFLRLGAGAATRQLRVVRTP
jgi:hypothetical protein